MSYYTFIKEQSKEFQDETLGEDVAKKLRTGEIDAEAFNKLSLDELFRPITLEEMKQKQELSFSTNLKGE